MALKNYTTKVPANRSVQEIQEMLQRGGASGILLEYEKGTGRIESLAFKMDFGGNPIGFKLPIKWRQAQKVMQREGNPRAYDEDYCYRVAWRIIRNWLEQQMALIEIEMVDMQEIFLPYAVQKDGNTLYQNILSNPQFLLPEGN
jgi:hypothetical protein